MGNCKKKVRPIAPDKKYCALCLEEKFEIFRQQPSLNHQKEVFSHCVHKKKYFLANVKRRTTTPDECHSDGKEIKTNKPNKTYKTK